MLRRLFPLLTLLATFGCTDDFGGRQEITGSITFKGAKLDNGFIQFVPVDPAAPTRAGAPIAAGHYTIAKPQGLMPGKYIVSISSPDGKTPESSEGAAPGPSGNFASKERIPAKYNAQSKEEIEVTKQGPNKFDFTIP